jgi:uncharacterized protein YndB with AHSA1/START domain
MYSTSVTRHISAPPAAVYRALLDAAAVARWRVPDGMTAEVHSFDAREGGYFRVSLTYTESSAVGKTSSHTDTYHGVFRRLVVDREVVEELEFESSDAALQGTMTMTTSLVGVDGGTEVTVHHEGLPDAVPAADNEAGTRMALDNLARVVEG